MGFSRRPAPGARARCRWRPLLSGAGARRALGAGRLAPATSDAHSSPPTASRGAADYDAVLTHSSDKRLFQPLGSLKPSGARLRGAGGSSFLDWILDLGRPLGRTWIAGGGSFLDWVPLRLQRLSCRQ